MKKTTQLIFSLLAILLAASLYASNSNDSVLLSPTITSFSPTSGLIGTTVTISGSNFSPTLSNNVVTINGTPTTVTDASATLLTITIPTGTTTGAIRVAIGSENITSSSVFTVLSTTSCNSVSNNNAKNWYFGNQAAMVFENDGPIALTNSAMGQVEGVATMSDANGNLLFYTNGITIYDRNHQPMVNGQGLQSHSSNTQAAFVVPFPGNPNQYFVITPGPYYYSIVDMTLDNGNGAILPNAKNILITNDSSEKVAGLQTSNRRDIWLITYSSSPSKFNTYRITPSGLDTTPVISAFPIASGHYGYMKISPDETKIAMANFNNSFHLYDFDAATGMVSNQKVINFTLGGHGSYGIEFSPNSKLVYVADHRGFNSVVQFNIALATPELIAASGVSLAANSQALGALQLGPDNKIYLAKESSPFLGVINQPNVIGLGCSYVIDGVDLAGKTSNLGLPGFVASSLVKTEPYISAFSPINGFSGDTVTITGTNFNSTPSNNIVNFNGTQAVVTAATETSLTVTVPSGASTGKIRVEVGCGLVATTNNFMVNVLGVNDVNELDFTIFPNPSSGMFHFTSKNPIAEKIEVYNILGRILLSKTNFDLTQTLDLSHLSNGTYFISITQGEAITTKKLLKK